MVRYRSGKVLQWLGTAVVRYCSGKVLQWLGVSLIIHFKKDVHNVEL